MLISYAADMAGAPPNDRYLQIGEAAERAQLTQRPLRYYAEQRLLPPPGSFLDPRPQRLDLGAALGMCS